MQERLKQGEEVQEIIHEARSVTGGQPFWKPSINIGAIMYIKKKTFSGSMVTLPTAGRVTLPTAGRVTLYELPRSYPAYDRSSYLACASQESPCPRQVPYFRRRPAHGKCLQRRNPPPTERKAGGNVYKPISLREDGKMEIANADLLHMSSHYKAKKKMIRVPSPSKQRGMYPQTLTFGIEFTSLQRTCLWFYS